MSSQSLRDLIEARFAIDSQQLPVFNRVALQLQRIKHSDDATIPCIAELIMRDQALASRVLQVANSAFFGGLRQIETLDAAVLRLGIERVSSIAMLASQALAHQARSNIIARHLPALWRRSYVCATGARWVAKHCGYDAQAEEAFLAGLLHDIGELFLLKVLDRLVEPDAQADAAALPLTEELIAEVLEALHAELGGRLMRDWQLPETYARVAREHHAEEFDENDTLLIVARLLDIVCQRLGIGQPAQPEIVLAATREAQVLGIKEIKLAQLEVMLEDCIAEAERML